MFYSGVPRCCVTPKLFVCRTSTPGGVAAPSAIRRVNTPPVIHVPGPAPEAECGRSLYLSAPPWYRTLAVRARRAVRWQPDLNALDASFKGKDIC